MPSQFDPQKHRRKSICLKGYDYTHRVEITSPLRAPTLGQVVTYFKYQSTKEMNALDGTGTITKFWQSNYYERIIRDERDMGKIWDYLETNSIHWADDDENPSDIHP